MNNLAMSTERLHELSDALSADAIKYQNLEGEFAPGHRCRAAVTAARAAVAAAYESVNAAFVEESQPKNPGAEE
jgi:hypothetical protein